MGWFLRSRAVYFIYFPGNQAKYLTLGLFIIAGQYYSEDRVLPGFCVWFPLGYPPNPVYGTNIRPTLGPIPAPHTFHSSFGRSVISRVWPFRH